MFTTSEQTSEVTDTRHGVHKESSCTLKCKGITQVVLRRVVPFN